MFKSTLEQWDYCHPGEAWDLMFALGIDENFVLPAQAGRTALGSDWSVTLR